ncbi:MAG: hypothetical protein IJK33_02515 [Clostridia bacterium]|nr:hypothetical protein [Selenomonadaceae bacterium]MBQ6182742.1 hypothetical protein [Clostridia bacterium]
MRKLKFRRKNLRGEWIYTKLFGEKFGFGEVADLYVNFCFDNDYSTLSQLVGVDKNGREVYEGDSVVDEWGNEYEASFAPVPELFSKCELKETDHEED